MKTSNSLWLFIGLATLAMMLIFAGLSLHHDTYNAEAELNPLSAVSLDKDYLAAYSDCSKKVLGAQIDNGLNPTRSDLFYTEWRCKIAQKSTAVSS